MVAIKKHRIIFVIFTLIVWELVSRSGIYNQALIPSVWSITSAFLKGVFYGEILFAVFNSFLVIINALIISLIITTIVLIISRTNMIIDDLVDFIISIFHPIPGIAILPLVIIWFGVGQQAITFVVVHSMLWPLILSIKNRVNELENSYSKISKSFNFSKAYELIHIYIIGCVPGIISGSKVAWSRGWRGFISAEMIFGVVGERSGLGWYLFEQRVYMDAPSLYAGLIAIIICGVIIENIVFVNLESKAKLRWYK